MSPCPRRGSSQVVAALAAALAAGACARAPRDESLTLREITPRFLMRLDARDPAIAADGGGRVALTWVTRDSSGADAWLAVSSDNGATFANPVRVNAGAGRVVSYSESRPIPALGPGGALALAWSELRGDTSGAVDVIVRASADGGRSLGPGATVNDDAAGPSPDLGPRAAQRWVREHNLGAFHGFPALTYLPDGGLFAAWLDERFVFADDEPRISSLYFATSDDGGVTWGANAALSDSACPCCRPRVVTGGDGALALAYRGASNDLRDPALALSRDRGRSFAIDTVISRDNWSLAACPDQGPGIIWNRERGGQYVWLTGAEPPGVYVVPWREQGGAGGLRRAIADTSDRAQHPMIAALGSALLLAVEMSAPDDPTRRVVAVRLLEPSGALTPWQELGANARAGWITGAGPNRALACWVEREAEGGRIRVAEISGRTRR